MSTYTVDHNEMQAERVKKEREYLKTNRRRAESFADSSAAVAAEMAMHHVAKLLAHGGRVRNVGFQRIAADPVPQPEGADVEYMHVVTVLADQ